MLDINDMVQILGAGKRFSASGKCTEGQYKGETCLMPKQNKYPVTTNGKLDPGKIRASITYGSQYNVLQTLKNNGLCGYAKKAGIKAQACGTAD